jgi:arylsulfatase A-like enzyme
MPDVPIGDWTDDWNDKHTSLHPALSVGKLPPHRLKRARAGYYGHISHIAHQLNRFFETMAEHGEQNNTIYCFTSDHGDMLGDHNMFRKVVPYQGSANVPMILKGPAASGIKRNTASDAVCELRDVMPTLLDCAGLPIPESVEGRSLLPYACGEEPQWRKYIHGEHTDGSNLSYHYITDGKAKYIWISDSGKEQFFDLTNDPQECRDLINTESEKDRIASFRNNLIKELTNREEGYVKDGTLIPNRPVKPCLSTLN